MSDSSIVNLGLGGAILVVGAALFRFSVGLFVRHWRAVEDHRTGVLEESFRSIVSGLNDLRDQVSRLEIALLREHRLGPTARIARDDPPADAGDRDDLVELEIIPTAGDSCDE
jgi:hypothetical protein